MLTTRSAWLQEASEASAAPLAPWIVWTIVAVVAVLVIAAVVAGIVVWRRRRAAAPPAIRSTSLAASLRPLWRRFYEHIPERARHYPTVVVLGAAGVGKTHAIHCHVDWQGQANQFRPSVDHEAAAQLYLGPDVIVHEISAPLLRDLSGGARRALRALWRRMGPSATVVLVVDARTLLTTPPAAARELAQLVRGKIGLFPRRVRGLLDVRIYLSHLDQIDGYDEFAGAVGPGHEGIDLARLGAGPSDAERLVAGFDIHLAYALTTRTGDEFDRMVRFYGALRELLGGLRPLLATLKGQDEPYAEVLPVSRLYLGSIVPRSHVGECFAVDRALIARSIDGHHRRGLRGAVLTGASALLLLGSLAAWHVQRIAAAEASLDAFDQFVARHVDLGDGTPAGTECHSDCAPVTISEDEVAAALELAAAIRDVKRSNVLWLADLYVARKVALDARFEAALRKVYLTPLLGCARPLRALYVVSLMFANRENELGRIIAAHRQSWSKELQLPTWVIDEYIAASDADNSDIVLDPEDACIKNVPREWREYLLRLTAALALDAIDPEEARKLQAMPPLRGPEEYEILKQARQALALDNHLVGSLRQRLIDDPIDWWSGEQHATLTGIGQLVRDHLHVAPLRPGETQGWGLHDLVTALSAAPVAIPGRFEVTIGGEPMVVDGAEMAGLLRRSRAKLLVDRVLHTIPPARLQDGRAFFSESAAPPAAGVVKGYGGGPSEVIAGVYTRDAFEHQVAPVLQFASAELAPAIAASAPSDRAARKLADADAIELEHSIRAAGIAYAGEYRRALIEYYESFALDPAADMALPFVFRPFWQPSSWFTEFLHAFAVNAAPTLPEGDPYFEPMARALDGFAPLVELLQADSAVIPGLAPYQALLAALQPKLGGPPGVPAAPELRERLSAVGVLMLDALQGKAADPALQVRQWLAEAGVDREWHDPFLAPLELVRDSGITNIEEEVERAWKHEVRPVVRPLLTRYPFAPLAATDAEPDEIEALVRTQGKERGEFWLAFDRLIAPVTARKDGKLTMLGGLESLSHLLYMPRDLERMAAVLWDADGARVPLKVVLRPLALPREAEDGRAAVMAHLRSGGGAVYAFNQRPERQTLALQWWNQGMSALSLEMRPLTGGEPRSYPLEEDGAFSFYRLLDRGAPSKGIAQRGTLTAIAIHRATRCPPNEPGGTRGLSMVWRVVIDEAGAVERGVRMVLESDPWAAFAVRDCD